MLYLIGLGLNDEGDISLKGLYHAKECDVIYAETYTSPWRGSFEALEKMFEKKIVILNREQLEKGVENIVEEARAKNVAVLVPGDSLSATTHFEFISVAKKKGVQVRVIHASSVYTAVAETGLHLYKFGRTTTLAYPEQGFEPVSPYDVIEQNKKIGLHTVVLLDIKKDENKFMTISEGVDVLKQLEAKMRKNLIMPETKIIACAMLGSEGQRIVYGSIEEIAKQNIEEVPACLIVPGDLNFKEEEALELWKM